MVWAKVKNLVPPEHEEEIRARIADGANIYQLIEECRRRFGAR